MDTFLKQPEIGILGGGQLGRMLQLKANEIDIPIAFMDPDPVAPCKRIGDKFVVGKITDYEHVMDFGKNKDVLSIEIENVNVEALKVLEKQGKKVYPQPHIIELIQDKGEQKLFYQANGIPTSPFHLIENKEELIAFKDKFPMVQKLRKGGYDGKGVHMLNDASDLDKAFTAPSLLEEKIPFEKELSVIVARNASGEIKSFPCVEQEFNPEANLVEFLFSPATISPEIEEKAQSIARKVIDALDMVGLLAVELFLTKDGEVLVNEIAPRPHNSGHQTIEGNNESQYGQLLRCLLDLPLGDTSITQPSVMVNLLGEKGYTGTAKYQGFTEVCKIPGVKVHLYGKKETKPFRKMGHITILAPTLDEAKKLAHKAKETLKVIA
jgi:5-(carboxyamino)imidazole ribonucleotide synthase